MAKTSEEMNVRQSYPISDSYEELLSLQNSKEHKRDVLPDAVDSGMCFRGKKSPTEQMLETVNKQERPLVYGTNAVMGRYLLTFRW